MTDLMHWAQLAALILLAWLGAGVLTCVLWYLALGPRRAERAYRRFER